MVFDKHCFCLCLSFVAVLLVSLVRISTILSFNALLVHTNSTAITIQVLHRLLVARAVLSCDFWLIFSAKILFQTRYSFQVLSLVHGRKSSCSGLFLKLQEDSLYMNFD